MTDSRAPKRIAFYAPLKSPSHPVASGDRLMARQLVACLGAAGHAVTVVSDLRARLGDSCDHAGWNRVRAAARAEVDRIGDLWQATGAPDLWFCYHPYYKAPDLIGPPLCASFGLPYVSCEASLSARRDVGIWAKMQAQVRETLARAALNICLTARDAAGLAAQLPGASLARLPPFIDITPFAAPPDPAPGHVVTVAMMRAGDKFDSYVRLAAALALLPPGLDWHLSVAGDGPLRADVMALYDGLPPGRVTWLGLADPPEVARLLSRAALYVWPGCGEAYGLAYLEAQAAGVPVVAMALAGVPEVVADGVTGLLVTACDDAAFAAAIAALLTDDARRADMAAAARARAVADHSMQGATRTLSGMLDGLIGGRG